MSEEELATLILRDIPEAQRVYVDFHAYQVVSDNEIPGLFDRVSVEVTEALAHDDRWINSIAAWSSTEERLIEECTPCVIRTGTVKA